MKIENVIIGKDIIVGKDKLATIRDIFSTLVADTLPATTPFCIVISMRADTKEIGKTVQYSVIIFTPNKKKSIKLGMGTLYIEQEITLLYLKGGLSFIEWGKHIINIKIESDSYEQAILDVTSRQTVPTLYSASSFSATSSSLSASVFSSSSSSSTHQKQPSKE